MSTPLLHLTVPGLPQPQGSSRAFVRGSRAIITSANPRLRQWRDRLALAISAHRLETRQARYDGAVRVHMRFYLPRPKSAPKRVVYPITKPDCDKLARGANDAITDAGVWRDDSQVVELHVTKCFASPTEHPGVELLVWAQEA